MKKVKQNNKILQFFIDVKTFVLCFLRKDCEYGIKKLLAIFTFFIVAYLAIFTEKNYYELLMFLAVLLGISSYDKRTWNANNIKNQQ